MMYGPFFMDKKWLVLSPKMK